MLKQGVLTCNTILQETWLKKVDKFKNVAKSLINSINTEKFSWCRQSMDIYALNMRPYKSWTPLFCKENNKWEYGECWRCVILFACRLCSNTEGISCSMCILHSSTIKNYFS